MSKFIIPFTATVCGFAAVANISATKKDGNAQLQKKKTFIGSAKELGKNLLDIIDLLF